MHNVSLDALIDFYKIKFRQEFGVELRKVIVWTDNAPHQYRCRQNFIKVASCPERHPGIVIVHRLAVVDNFKGIHDAVGKDPAHLGPNSRAGRYKVAYCICSLCQLP